MLMRFFILLTLSLSSLIAENKPTVFQVDQSKNLVEQTQNASDQGFEKEIAQDYKPVEFKGAFFKMLFWLAVLIFFAFLTFYMFKKLSHSRLETANQNKAIKILEKRALSPKTVLYLVEYNNKKILIGESQNELKIKIFDKEA